MLLLLKNEKFTQPVWIPSWCSFASLRFLFPCYWNFQRNTDTARDGLDAGRTLLVPDVSELQQRIGWVAHTVVCALSFSSLVTPKMQTVKGIAGIITLVLIHVCFGFIFLTVGFSLILYFMYGLSKMRLPQNRVLAYVPPALFECFGMYSLCKEWFVAWHLTDALTDSTSLMH